MAFISMTPRFNCSSCNSEIEDVKRINSVETVSFTNRCNSIINFYKYEFSPSQCPNCKEPIEYIRYKEDNFDFASKYK